MTPMPIRRPQAAPIARDGMKTPLDTLKPYVHTDSRKHAIVKAIKVMGLYDSVVWIKITLDETPLLKAKLTTKFSIN